MLAIIVMFNAVLLAWLLGQGDPKPTEVAQKFTTPEVTKEEKQPAEVKKEENKAIEVPKVEEKKVEKIEVAKVEVKKEEKKIDPPMPKIEPKVEPNVELREPPLLKCPATAAEVKRSQQAWADYLKVKVFIEEDLGNGVKLKLVLIPPGKFRMGSTQDEIDSVLADFSYAKKEWFDGEKPSREVTISKAFYMGKSTPPYRPEIITSIPRSMIHLKK